MSDGTVNSIPSPEKEGQAKAEIKFSAPDDAKACIRIDSLKQYIRNESKLI